MTGANDNLPIYNLMWLFDQLDAMAVKYSDDLALVEVLACAADAIQTANEDSISAQHVAADLPDGCPF